MSFGSMLHMKTAHNDYNTKWQLNEMNVLQNSAHMCMA